MKSKFLIVITLLSTCALAQTDRVDPRAVERLSRQINAIAAYCGTVESLERRSQPLMLVSWSPDAGVWERWNMAQASGKRPLYEAAAKVWLKDEHVVGVQLSSRSDTRRGIEYTEYCYREDGSLARVRVTATRAASKQNLLHSEVPVPRDMYFGEGGTRLGGLVDFRFDQRPLKSERTTFTYLRPSAVYRSVQQLPFINLIFRPV